MESEASKRDMNVFMFDDIREDLRAYNGKWGAQGFWAMVVYRFGRWRYGVRLVFVRKFLSLIYRALYKVVQIVGRLMRCLKSLSATAAMVPYVDSGSTDGSAQGARDQDVDVTELDTTIPFTAARARNAGFKRLRMMAPDLAYVQFVDGDCELIEDWPEHAISFLDAHALMHMRTWALSVGDGASAILTDRFITGYATVSGMDQWVKCVPAAVTR